MTQRKQILYRNIKLSWAAAVRCINISVTQTHVHDSQALISIQCPWHQWDLFPCWTSASYRSWPFVFHRMHPLWTSPLGVEASVSWVWEQVGVGAELWPLHIANSFYPGVQLIPLHESGTQKELSWTSSYIYSCKVLSVRNLSILSIPVSSQWQV